MQLESNLKASRSDDEQHVVAVEHKITNKKVAAWAECHFGEHALVAAGSDAW